MPGTSPVHITGSEATLRGSLACVTTLLDTVLGTRPSREHGPTLASSVVAEEVAGRGDV